jgi:glutamate 5-kinase
MQRQKFTQAGTWVIKLGSAILTNDGQGLSADAIRGWVEQIVQLRQRGYRIVLVSSGAVAEGMQRLGWQERPHALRDLQAAAAVGQMGLVQAYESAFMTHGIRTAQILLTHDDLSDRRRYLNARSTLHALLDLNVIPIIENDTVAIDEIRFGDTDTLGALVVNLVEADLLLILTDQAALFDADPRINAQAQRIAQAPADDEQLDAMVSEGGKLGRGGMITKLRAARLAARSAGATWILPGRRENVLLEAAAGADIGTLLTPSEEQRLAARKRWLAGHLQLAGKLWLDEGAVRVLKESGKSLLAVGVRKVEGVFGRGEVVACLDPDGQEVARGLVNYDADEARKIAGQPSAQIEAILGYIDEQELIHRNNMILSR